MRSVGYALLCAAVLLPLAAAARPLRPRFEPDDMELERPGVVEVNLQLGFVQSRGPYRLVVPDVEIDIGAFRNLEIDLDWTYALEQPFDHSAGDNVWLSAKIGVLDVADGAQSSWALGVQLGPRFGAAPGARGIGFEGLVLVARQRRRLHVVLSSGVLVDPALNDAYRPIALEAGIDVSFDLDARGVWSLTGDAAAVYFASIDPNQIALSAGAAWTPRPWLSVSLTALCGFLDGGDVWGVLVGYSQKFVSTRARATPR
jgi:hypothetical protein